MIYKSSEALRTTLLKTSAHPPNISLQKCIKVYNKTHFLCIWGISFGLLYYIRIQAFTKGINSLLFTFFFLWPWLLTAQRVKLPVKTQSDKLLLHFSASNFILGVKLIVNLCVSLQKKPLCCSWTNSSRKCDYWSHSILFTGILILLSIYWHHFVRSRNALFM